MDLKQNSSPDVKVFLIGNKADLEDSRLIKKEKGLQLQKDYEFDFFIETSSKTGMNAQEIFVEAAFQLYKDYAKYKKKQKKSGEQLKSETLKRDRINKGCC